LPLTKHLLLFQKRVDKAYRSDFTEAAKWAGHTVEVSQKPPTEKVSYLNKVVVKLNEASLGTISTAVYPKINEKTVDSYVAFTQLSFISIILAKF
jgi:hypothetical protein